MRNADNDAFITLATFNQTSDTVNFLDNSIATPLEVTGNATAGAEIRLPEDTDNGSHYVALKAASSIASNVTFIYYPKAIARAVGSSTVTNDKF